MRLKHWFGTKVAKWTGVMTNEKLAAQVNDLLVDVNKLVEQHGALMNGLVGADMKRNHDLASVEHLFVSMMIQAGISEAVLEMSFLETTSGIALMVDVNEEAQKVTLALEAPAEEPVANQEEQSHQQ